MPVAPSYPDWEVGDLVTADMLTAALPALLVKPGASSRSSTVTPTADPDLTGITLGIGTWEVELVLFFNQATTDTQGLQTMWGFSGTWNNPIRACVGPPNASPGTTRDSLDKVNLGGFAANVGSKYLVVNGSGYVCVREISATVVVTVAGDLSLLWSQAASVANATSVQPGSYFRVKQIA